MEISNEQLLAAVTKQWQHKDAVLAYKAQWQREAQNSDLQQNYMRERESNQKVEARAELLQPDEPLERYISDLRSAAVKAYERKSNLPNHPLNGFDLCQFAVEAYAAAFRKTATSLGALEYSIEQKRLAEQNAARERNDIIARADKAIAHKNYGSAEQIYKNYLSDHPDDGEIKELLAEAEREHEEYRQENARTEAAARAAAAKKRKAEESKKKRKLAVGIGFLVSPAAAAAIVSLIALISPFAIFKGIHWGAWTIIFVLFGAFTAAIGALALRKRKNALISVLAAAGLSIVLGVFSVSLPRTFKISTPEELQYMYRVPAKHYVLNNDIDLDGVTFKQIPVLKKGQTFDGGEYAIKNLDIIWRFNLGKFGMQFYEGISFGIFGNCDGTIKKITLNNCHVVFEGTGYMSVRYLYTGLVASRSENGSGSIEEMHLNDCSITVGKEVSVSRTFYLGFGIATSPQKTGKNWYSSGCKYIIDNKITEFDIHDYSQD